MKIAVIGTGYVGLVTGTCFSEMGHDVTCVDIDETKVDALKRGQVPICEPCLDEMVEINMAHGRLAFTTDIRHAVAEAQIVFIAVGTPPKEDGKADLQYVLGAAGAIGQYMEVYTIVVNKSTVPVGTAGQVAGAIREVLAERLHQWKRVIVSPPYLLRGCEKIVFRVLARRVEGKAASQNAPGWTITHLRDTGQPHNFLSNFSGLEKFTISDL